MFRHSTKLILAGLTTAAVMATGGCSKKADQQQGSASVSVHALSLAHDVKAMDVAVTGTGIPTPMEMPLFLQGDGTWKATINHIPVGSGRSFMAKAYDSTAKTHQIYSGSVSSVTIVQNTIADVIIVLQEGGTAGNFANHAPVVDGLTVSSTSVAYGDKVSYTLIAHDPDAGETATMTFKPTVTCGSFGTPTVSTDAQGRTVWANIWTAPTSGTSCQLNMEIDDLHGAQATSSIIISIGAGAATGGARVSTLVESWPVITNITATPAVIPLPAGSTQLTLVASEPDGDPMTFSWTTDCTGGGFDNNTVQNPVFTLNPGYVPVTCLFNVVVSGPTRTPTNGTPQTLVTTGSLTVNVGQPPVTAPLGGPVIDLTSQSAEMANAGDAVTLYVKGRETNSSASLASYTWTPSAGSVLGTQVDGPSESTSQVVWTAPSPMGPTETVIVLLVDTEGATASYTFTFAQAVDPCAANGTDGNACSDGNPCTLNDTCQNHVCVPGAAKSCPASDGCHTAGTCDTVTGDCSNPVAPNGTTCEDGNPCTQTDRCTGGTCIGASPVVCTAQDACHTAGTCDTGTGSCSNPVAPDTTPCSDGNACTSGDACQAGVCVGGPPTICTALDACHVAGTCNPQIGGCSNPPAPDQTPCSDGNGCTVGDVCISGQCTSGAPLVCQAPDLCHLAGTCDPVAGCSAGTAKTCDWGQACRLSDGACATSCPAPKYAKQFAVTSLNGMAVDASGNQFVVASLYGTGVSFDGATVSSAGGADVVLAKLDPATGLASWAKVFSGSAADENPTPSDQAAAGVAVSKANVGVIGQFTSGLQINSTTHLAGGASLVDYVMGTDSSGTGVWGVSINTQSGALGAIAANPALDEFVVCGYAMGGVTDLGLPGTYSGDGNSDIIIAKLSALDGHKIWARQIGGAGSQFCSAAAMDANGKVYAAGTYNGTLDLGTGLLPDGGTTTYGSSVLGVWVAEMDSADGHTLVAKSYSDNIGKQTVKGIAVDGSGNVAVTGNLRNHAAFGGTTLTSVGGTDGFLAKLKNSDLTTLWARSWGDSTNQEAHGVAFSSVGDVVVVGFMNGSVAGLGSSTLTSAGSSDAYWAKFNGADGTSVCAANYGDNLGQVADTVAISSAATGAQKDMVNVAGYATGNFSFGTGMPFSSATSNGFVLQMNP